MEKFKKRMIITVGLLGLLLVGGLNYKIANKPKIMEIPKEEKKETLAIYIQDTDGNYQMSNAKEFPKDGYVLNLEKSTCKNGGILSQDSVTKKIRVSLYHTDQCTLYFDEDLPTLKDFYDSVPKKTINPNFANAAVTDETIDGLFALEDDYGTSYYFRGAVENNYVKFGINANGQDMWWRIIRFNGDGSVRMQYDGTRAHENGVSSSDRFALSSQPFASDYIDAKYVGWMHGGANGVASTSKEQAQRNETSSPIKIAVENWYKTNIIDTGYSKYVADAIFCNDRSTPGEDTTGLSKDTGLGYGSNKTGYGAYARSGVESVNYNNVLPQFTCPQENDKFTVEMNSGGNGALTYPVGLITADEIMAAGSGKYATDNYKYYLQRKYRYWSLTPSHVSGAATYGFTVNDGWLDYSSIRNKYYVAPVINIKAEYLSNFKGTGYATNPFRLK